jgi:hypothetical protein
VRACASSAGSSDSFSGFGAQSGEVASEPNIDFTTLNRIKVGLAAVSFPKPGEDQGTLLNRSWKTSMNRQIQKLLNEFTAKT